jgi:hypothetical protein
MGYKYNAITGELNVSITDPIPVDYANEFVTDSGTAVPAAHVINFIGDATQGISSSGAGSTVTYTLSDATSSQKGVSELATDAESIAGSDTSRTIVPSSLNAKLGSLTANSLPFGQGSSSAIGWTSALTDGQMMIGSTGVAPSAGVITSSGGTITVTTGAGTLNLDVAGGTTAIDSFSPDSGTDPVVPTVAGLVNMSGSGSLTTVGSLNTLTFQLTGLTQYNVLVGAGSTTITKVAPGATGIPLVSQGAAADPAFSTAVVGGGGTGATSLTDGGILLGSGTAAVTVTAQPVNGELLMGSTGVDPVLATITAGANVTVTNGAGSITIAADGGGDGDVVGPAAATDNALARYNTTSGKLLQDSSVIVTDAGEMTNASQPCFLATHSADQLNVTGDGTQATVAYTTEITDQNADYDGTDTFTAPVAGNYSFNGNVFISNTGAATQARIFIVTSNRSYAGNVDTPISGSSVPGLALIAADMDALDTCTAAGQASGTTKTVHFANSVSDAYFSGSLNC